MRRTPEERSACGVGFVASTTGQPSRSHLDQALAALECIEHRGGCLADGKTGDGAGIMTEVPFELFGKEKGEVAVATLFLMVQPSKRAHAVSVFEQTFGFFGLEVIGLRDVPIDTSVLGRQARETLPTIVHAFIKRPGFCRTAASFDTALYHAKQSLRTHMRRAGFGNQLFCTSLSTSTIIYKALTRSEDLQRFYPDLRESAYRTRFALFHRRFSTNTSTSWDKAQPFRMIAHNGEINTIACNRAWSYSREQALGIPKDELLTHEGISDTGSLNEMVEALRYRSSIPGLDEILAIMVPPADKANEPFYKFWSRAIEPWDGPAFLSFSDGTIVGARLDRNGFRPCRWARTKDAFYLASEAGLFELNEGEILAKGTIHGGAGAHVILETGEVSFADPSKSRQNRDATFDPRLEPIGREQIDPTESHLDHRSLFRWCKEDVDEVLIPMMSAGKEPIGSMGDTARPAIFSDLPRSFFDFFYQTFAQVTNPPLDHLRERMVTDLRTYLGGRPNVFAPKELLPLKPGIELETPILDLEQMAYVRKAAEKSRHGRCFEAAEFSITFPRVRGAEGLREALDTLSERVLAAIRGGCSILILTDRKAKLERPPIPSLLALRAADQLLTQWGNRLDVSIVVDTADVRSTHHVAALISFGAAAVCPYLAFELCEGDEKKQANLRAAFEGGLLKIMSKMGISSVRGYQSSRLFTAYGLSRSLLDDWFPGLDSAIGGYDLSDIGEMILRETEHATPELQAVHTLREHAKGAIGERHSMTSALAKLIHQQRYQEYADLAHAAHPINPRHLLRFKKPEKEVALEDVQPEEEILRRFSSGAMSFGAISAESQRDLIRAMHTIGGRSASGEGGENPYYFVDGTTASSKQVASARFGVTAEYLITAQEIEIKIAQGAKPGEGGQLMAVKVDEHIARARHAKPGVDLISPAPLHDIYSIEDLRQLIYELKQLKDVRVSVKLVSGVGIGAIAAGVVKAGADVIQISGGDGGTGAASLSSMKHAGLAWELGLDEVHRTLVEQRLREHVVLRVDGGLSTGTDVVMAAMLGAEEFGFGKILLVAEGCIMARVCEKNTCPRGIATHDPKYKAKYRGTPEDVVALLRHLAQDVRRILASVGADRLDTIVGRTGLLEADPRYEPLILSRKLDLSRLLDPHPHELAMRGSLLREGVSRLNARITEDVLMAIDRGERLMAAYQIKSTDRALLATASGALAERTHRLRMKGAAELLLPPSTIQLEMIGSAGQGFGVFLVEGFDVTLRGEANDSVGKSMSGGRLVIVPHSAATLVPEDSSIIGNCALYGATGGKLFVYGRAGDRFAVRNSGAIAVVEGTGLHACEYMTNGTVVILGSASHNIGAGMTGGELFLRRESVPYLNTEYLIAAAIEDDALDRLASLLAEYRLLTGSRTAPSDREALREGLVRCVPRSSFTRELELTKLVAS